MALYNERNNIFNDQCLLSRTVNVPVTMTRTPPKKNNNSSKRLKFTVEKASCFFKAS